MKQLSEPCSYRFFLDQKAHMQKMAKESGHHSEVIYLRQLVEADMREQNKKRAKPSTR